MYHIWKLNHICKCRVNQLNNFCGCKLKVHAFIVDFVDASFRKKKITPPVHHVVHVVYEPATRRKADICLSLSPH